MDNDVKMVVLRVPMCEILADDEFNCRGRITPTDVVDLARDIETNGLLQPVTVAPLNPPAGGYKYRLIAGFRRYTAHKVLKRTDIPALVRAEPMDEAQARVLNLSENIQRKELNIMQEARAIQKLKDLGLNEFDTASRLGMSRGWVQVRYMLLNLPEDIQIEAAAGVLNQTDVRAVYTVLKQDGKSAAYEAVRTLKDAKARGTQAIIKPVNATKRQDKRIRKKVEIMELMNSIQDTLGNSVVTRALAWCAGEIGDTDIDAELKKLGLEQGKIYVTRDALRPVPAAAPEMNLENPDFGVLESDAAGE